MSKLLRVLIDQHNDPSSININETLGIISDRLEGMLKRAYNCIGFFGILTDKDARFESAHQISTNMVYIDKANGIFVSLDILGIETRYWSYDQLRVTTNLADRRKALCFANTAKKRANVSIEAWLMIARRIGVVRDIRALIARQLWRDRHHWIQ